MRITSRRGVARSLFAVIVMVAFLVPVSDAAAVSVTLTFDEVNAASAPSGVPAESYLAGFGITLSAVTAGTTVAIFDDQNVYGGVAMEPSSLPNIMTQVGSNDPVSFTMQFSTPLESFAFTRPLLIAGPSGITHPAWQAYAFNALSVQLASVSEPLISSFLNVSAATYTLNGPGITSVRIDSQNQHFAAFSAVLIDDVVLTTPVPEPGTVLLLSGGLAGLGALARHRRSGRSAG